MESNNKEYTLLLENHFPTVIAEMIISYIDKYNLQFVEIFNSSVYNFMKKLFNKSCETLHLMSIMSIFDIIDENTIIFKSKLCNEYKIFDINKNKIIKKFVCDGNYCTSDGKYLVIASGSKLNIFSISEKKVISTIQPIYTIASEITIVNDIVYVTLSSTPKILKYGLNGERIGSLNFRNKFLGYEWIDTRIKITKNEIIILVQYDVIFFDLNGNILGKSDIQNYGYVTPYVTNDYICIFDKDTAYKYKRII
jgi:hypothetical protein